MGTNIEVRGIDQAIARLKALQVSLPRVAATGSRGVLAAIFAASQVEVPRRTGALASSGHLSPLIGNGDDYRASITYGPLSYAKMVHYNNRRGRGPGRRLPAHHQPPTKAYFLIDPFRELGRAAVDAAKTAVRAETGP